MFPRERDLRRERLRFLATIESLGDEDFDHGRTLCAGWTPRDVLAHVTGADRLGNYVGLSGLTIDRANAAMVARARSVDRPTLERRGREVAERPSLGGRMSAAALLVGDVVVHHQDVLRGLGMPHELPEESRWAIMREASIWHVHTLMRYRLTPTDGFPARGRGRTVRGTTEALAMWLAGREGIEGELDFE